MPKFLFNDEDYDIEMDTADQENNVHTRNIQTMNTCLEDYSNLIREAQQLRTTNSILEKVNENARQSNQTLSDLRESDEKTIQTYLNERNDFEQMVVERDGQIGELQRSTQNLSRQVNSYDDLLITTKESRNNHFRCSNCDNKFGDQNEGGGTVIKSVTTCCRKPLCEGCSSEWYANQMNTFSDYRNKCPVCNTFCDGVSVVQDLDEHFENTKKLEKDLCRVIPRYKASIKRMNQLKEQRDDARKQRDRAMHELKNARDQLKVFKLQGVKEAMDMTKKSAKMKSKKKGRDRLYLHGLGKNGKLFDYNEETSKYHCNDCRRKYKTMDGAIGHYFTVHVKVIGVKSEKV